MESNLGYSVENCVSCCSLCNYLKNKTPMNIFLKRVRHIVSYKENNISLFDESFPDFISGNYKQYKISATVRGFDFSLSESTFYDITKNHCYMCGKKNSVTHINGIDRYDNSLGYIETNCKSCCNTCNMMKNKYSFNDIISKFNKIILYSIK